MSLKIAEICIKMFVSKVSFEETFSELNKYLCFKLTLEVQLNLKF